ncbi:carbohydrate porin [Aquipseudomonas campi]
MKPNNVRFAYSLLTLMMAAATAPTVLADDSEWMLGDWGGLRTELRDKGYEFQINYTGEAAANVSGGYSSHRTGRYADQFYLGTHLDLQKILGWDNADFQLGVTERSGRNITGELSDPRTGGLGSVQEVYGRGKTWRLTQMWYRQSFFDKALDFKVGRFGPGEDFASFDCKFQNLAFCGAQIGNWAGDIIYNWPVSQWAGRVKLSLTPDTYVQVGAFEMNPSYLDPDNGFKLSGSGNKGAMIPVELVHQLQLGGLPGEYRIGAYRSSASADDVYRNTDGAPLAVDGGDPKSHGSKHGYWAVAKQQVWADAGNAARGLNLFATVTLHDKDTSKIDRFMSAGLTYTAPFDSRPKDEIGFAVANIHVNDRFSDNQRLTNRVSGAVDYNDANYLPVQGSETNVELYYGLQATRWLVVRPNVQFVGRPGGVSAVDDAWIAGVKFSTDF